MVASDNVIPVPTKFGYELNKIKGAANAARIYFPAREFSTVRGGSGAVQISDIKRMCDFNIRPILKKWDGVFWRLTSDFVLLYSPQVIAEKLGISYPTGHVTFIPADNFKKIKTTRASLWAGFVNSVSAPISQASINAVTGTPISTQRTYLKELDFPYVINDAVFEYNGKKLEWNPQIHKIVSEQRNCFAKKVGGKLYLATRIPSEYRQPYKTGFRRRLRQNRSGRSELCETGIKQRFTRVFYGSKEKDDDAIDMKQIKFYSDHNNVEEQDKVERSSIFEFFGFAALPTKRTWRAILPFAQDWLTAIS
jgi:hypothetical protein